MKTKEIVPHGEEGHFCHGGCAGYSQGGEITQDDMVKLDKYDPKDRMTQDDMMFLDKIDPSTSTDTVKGYAEGGMAQEAKNDPADLPEEIREYVEKAHKERRESRPDEGWHVKAADKPESVAPYKRDEEDKEPDVLERLRGFAKGGQIPGYADGGGPDIAQPFDVDGGASDTVKMNGQVPTPPPAIHAPIDLASIPPPAASLARGVETPPATNVPRGTMPWPTDQSFMDRANKMLGLGPDQQAGFMKLLGGNAQKAQLGSAVAGLGDAIASGGTLGKVNPGALNKSEELINDRTKEGIEGMQTIRGNQEKAAEMADKLEARDPQSPLSKWAQKAYASVGKKIGLDLTNASAALIGDVTGKGVEALNTQYQNELKMLGLDLQKKQVEATIGNQKAERAATKEQHQQEAAKTLADRGVIKRSLDTLTGNEATKTLEHIAKGQDLAGPYGAQTTRNGKAYVWSPETGKYHLKS